MILCKECKSEKITKNGIADKKQRYKCKTCGLNFRKGDERTNHAVKAKKTLCILLYAMAKGSYRMLFEYRPHIGIPLDS